MLSSDLNPLDYFPWGNLKERVYQDNPDIIEGLKQNIRRQIRIMPRDMLEGVVKRFSVRVAAVLLQRRAWIDHAINYHNMRGK